jgi:hypothetical protein
VLNRISVSKKTDPSDNDVSDNDPDAGSLGWLVVVVGG